MPKCRKSITLRSFDDFRKRGNFLITRRSGVASDATRREAFAAEGCSRIPPPLPSEPSESKGSGGFSFQASAAVGGISNSQSRSEVGSELRCGLVCFDSEVRNLGPNAPFSWNCPDHIASLEWHALESFACETSPRVAERDSRLLGAEVRE